jgi:hypothetical protein
LAEALHRGGADEESSVKNLPEIMMRAVAQAQALPDQLTAADFEVVEWDGQGPINGAAPAKVREALVTAESAPCPDARVLLVRERASGIVFVAQHLCWTDANQALASDADVEQTAAQLREVVVPRLPAADASGPVMRLLANAAEASGVPPAALANMLGGLPR